MDAQGIINRMVKQMTEMIKAIVNGEFEIMLPKHRADRPEWYQPHGWEKLRLKSMSENIGKGDVVYYVGAEEGEMPALCQMWGSPMAEACDLKSHKCGFDPHRGHAQFGGIFSKV